MKYFKLFLVTVLLTNGMIFGQNISHENVNFSLAKQPKKILETSQRTYSVKVKSPYNLTAESIENDSKIDFEQRVKNYDSDVAKSEVDFQNKLKEHEIETQKAKEKFELESQEFKKLSLLERMTITDQGKQPKLVLPAKPVYHKPLQPVYQKPNLNDYLVINDEILATKIELFGYKSGGNNVVIEIEMEKVTFQDNAGQTYAKQPTTVKVKVLDKELPLESFSNDFEFVSSMPTNSINKVTEERNFINKTISRINKYLNDELGFPMISKTVKLGSVKNKGDYNDLEKAHIYVSTNLKKINPSNLDITKAAFDGLQKGIDIWEETLKKIDYNDKKALLNSKISGMIHFNLIRLYVAMEDRKKAEKYLNELQEQLVFIKLSYDEQNELKRLETEIYKL